MWYTTQDDPKLKPQTLTLDLKGVGGEGKDQFFLLDKAAAEGDDDDDSDDDDPDGVDM